MSDTHRVIVHSFNVPSSSRGRTSPVSIRVSVLVWTRVGAVGISCLATKATGRCSHNLRACPFPRLKSPYRVGLQCIAPFFGLPSNLAQNVLNSTAQFSVVTKAFQDGPPCRLVTDSAHDAAAAWTQESASCSSWRVAVVRCSRLAALFVMLGVRSLLKYSSTAKHICLIISL